MAQSFSQSRRSNFPLEHQLTLTLLIELINVYQLYSTDGMDEIKHT